MRNKSKKVLFDIISEGKNEVFTEKELKKNTQLFSQEHINVYQKIDIITSSVGLKFVLNLDVFAQLSFPLDYIFDKGFYTKINSVFNLVFLVKKVKKLLGKS